MKLHFISISQSVSKSLQDPEITLATSATLYSFLSAFFDSLKKILEILKMKQKVMFPMLTIEVHLKGQEKEKDILMNFLILQSQKSNFLHKTHLNWSLSIPSWKHWNQTFQKEQRCTHLLPKLFIPYWSRKFRGNDVNRSQKPDWSIPWRWGVRHS